ncbi:MAG: bifunctional phosphoribosylaminoimidazolecarboxamide formyltransferase/IMP cyclohydrolase [Elusimicrobia bacterium RIFOXYB2_FULL_49_7]|nr:MAG: bifunctional phosphoribosylaminoimidazolecarboxamide formyltransferase/IMP cyclohydrolase [Elusimicrobia bacterium RIFOXYB2_FULL_49_7]
MTKKRALVSVSDKTHLTDFCQCLVQLNYEILSTGGTAKALTEAGIPVTAVSDYTGFPEIMDGRVKTLHPKIHGGLLGIRTNATHAEAAKGNGIEWIDLVVVNLYPFEKTVEQEGVSLEEAIENIDIGGPSMLRSAAKNHAFVTVIVDPADYKRVLEELNINGDTGLKTRQTLAAKVFAHTARYDAAIDTFLSKRLINKTKLHLAYDNGSELRYGENPHQSARFYLSSSSEETLANAKKLHGKELSYNNLVDADAALDAVKELSGNLGAAIIKHMNPCGLATGETLEEALEMAWAGDTVSAFGSVIAVNGTVDIRTARRLSGRFVEILMAPAFESDALEFLKNKSKDIRLLQFASLSKPHAPRRMFRQIEGGLLEQDNDRLLAEKMICVTRAAFPDNRKALADFAYKAVKNVKSNAIILAREYRPGLFMVLGMGAGQPNRVDAIRKLCVPKVLENLRLLHEKEKSSMPLEEFNKKTLAECVLASDAFFPFDDNIIHADEAGVRFIIQPGGSKADNTVIETCDRLGIAMIFTGTRHFKH